MPNISSYFPITDPTLIFFLLMLIILLVPIVMGKLRIPHIVGMILAGVIVGPYGFGVLDKDTSFDIFGKVGLYFIMLLAGLEMSMDDFHHNRFKTITHGVLAFAVPMVMGFVLNTSVLKYGLLTSTLLASMYASHTLIAYPTIMRFGLSGERSVTIAVGATAITDTLTLLVLAMIVGVFKGDVTGWFWVWLVIKTALVFTVIIMGFPRMARRFFKHYDNHIFQFVFVILLMFLGAILMELAHLEGLLGAFLTGLVLNRYIPRLSQLMYSLEFVGNAIFIPYFLIGVGMLVNVRTLTGWGTWRVALVMVLVALSSKWIASLLTQKTFRLKALEREMIYGLSSAQAGATLAAVMVGYNLILPNGQRLLNEEVLNGTIFLILVTCLLSSLVTEHASKRMVLSHRDTAPLPSPVDDERILIPVKYPEIADGLTTLGVMMRNKKLNRGLVVINVVYDDRNTRQNMKRGRELLDHVVKYAGAMGVMVQTQERIAINIATGIRHALNEFQASEIIMGLHSHFEQSEKFWGNFHQSLFSSLSRQIIMARIHQPLNTIRRIQVAVPSRAQYESGFYRWLERLSRLAGNLECRIQFHGRHDTLSLINEFVQNNHHELRAEYSAMEHWNELPKLATTIADDHMFVVVTARKGTVSYKVALDKLPEELTKYFNGKNLMIIFPDQFDVVVDEMTYVQPLHPDDNSAYDVLQGWVRNKMKKKTPEGDVENSES